MRSKKSGKVGSGRAVGIGRRSPTFAAGIFRQPIHLNLQHLALETGSHFLSQNMMHTCVVRYNDTDEVGIRVCKWL